MRITRLIQKVLWRPRSMAPPLTLMCSRARTSVKAVLAQPFKNPLIIGAFLGLMLNVSGWQPPAALMEPFHILGGAGVPLILAAFGMSLRDSRVLQDPALRGVTIFATVFKSLVMPAVAFVLARFVFQMDDAEIFAATVLSALPSAQNVYNFAVRYNVAVTLAP